MQKNIILSCAIRNIGDFVVICYIFLKMFNKSPKRGKDTISVRKERFIMSNGKSLLLGIMVGGTIGAAATLLSTPSSGRDIRGRVKGQGIDLVDLFKNLKQDGLKLKDQISKTSKEGASLIKDLTQEMKKSVEEWKETVEPHQENIHHYLEQIESSLRDLEDKVKQ